MSALIPAFIENYCAAAATIEKANALVNQSAATTHEADLIRMVKDALLLAANAKELSDWVYPSRRPMEFVKALGKAQALKEAGLESDEVKRYFENLLTRSVGNPVRRRQSFIAAFEFMLESKNNSQGRATRKFCRCGKEKHNSNCEQNLKAGVRSVKNILRKYAPQLVNRYDSLHPDRAKKVNG